MSLQSLEVWPKIGSLGARVVLAKWSRDLEKKILKKGKSVMKYLSNKKKIPQSDFPVMSYCLHRKKKRQTPSIFTT